MPYVEGESLRDRLDRETQLPVQDTIQITAEVADGLSYAHDQGVIHRDIKPGNILLTGSHALIADFGIARAVTEAGGSRLTGTGLSLGTPQYMSPEQLTGDREADARSDQYSLACVAYEMLAGEPPFAAPTSQAILANILTQPARRLSQRRRKVPPGLETAVHRALERLPADRYSTLRDFSRALTAEPTSQTAPGFAATPRAGGNMLAKWTPWIIAAATAGLALWTAVGDRASSSALQVRLSLPGLPGGTQTGNEMDVSPDGKLVVYRADSGGLVLQPLDELRQRDVPSTEDARAPRFSPDGRSLLFFEDGALYTVAVEGSVPLQIVDSVRNRWADWGADGFVYFTHVDRTLARVPAVGGQVERLVTPDFEQEAELRNPNSLPNGTGVLFTINRWPALRNDIAVLNLETRETRVLMRGTHASYANSGHIVFRRADGSLRAVPFDERRLDVTGPPIPVADRVGGAIRISSSGAFLYLVQTGRQGLVLVDRAGVPQVLEAEIEYPPFPRVSPDGQRIAMQMHGPDGIDIWTYGLTDRTMTRLTFEGDNIYPSWSPDGDQVLFASALTGAPGGQWEFFRVDADGSGLRERILDREGPQVEILQAPDAGWFVYREGDVARGHDSNVYAIEANQLNSQRVIAATPYYEEAIAVSPDSRWVAYMSNESGRYEVYVRPIDGGEGRWQVSRGGGLGPAWGDSGRELFYLANGQLVVADVQSDPAFRVLRRTPLFSIDGLTIATRSHTEYDVLPGDQRFLFYASGEDDTELIFGTDLRELISR